MNAIPGLMQDKQLMISDFIGYAQTYHPAREIVSRDADGNTHRRPARAAEDQALLVRLQWSACGPFERCQGGLTMSVVRGRPEVTGTRPN